MFQFQADAVICARGNLVCQRVSVFPAPVRTPQNLFLRVCGLVPVFRRSEYPGSFVAMFLDVMVFIILLVDVLCVPACVPARHIPRDVLMHNRVLLLYVGTR